MRTYNVVRNKGITIEFDKLPLSYFKFRKQVAKIKKEIILRSIK